MWCCVVGAEDGKVGAVLFWNPVSTFYRVSRAWAPMVVVMGL